MIWYDIVIWYDIIYGVCLNIYVSIPHDFSNVFFNWKSQLRISWRDLQMDLNGPAVEEVDRVGGTLGGFKWRDMGSL